MRPLVLALVLLGASAAQGDPSAAKIIGQPAPQIALKTISRKGFSLTEQRGKFVVLHFAASW